MAVPSAEDIFKRMYVDPQSNKQESEAKKSNSEMIPHLFYITEIDAKALSHHSYCSENGSKAAHLRAALEQYLKADLRAIREGQPLTVVLPRKRKKSTTKEKTVTFKCQLTPELGNALARRAYREPSRSKSGHVRAALEIYLKEDYEAIRKDLGPK